MDQQTYDKKIRELKASTAADAPSRIAYLEKFYKTQLAEEADAKAKKREAAEAAFKGSLKTSYMQQPNATEIDFERDYPTLRTEHLKKKALQADEAARFAMSRGVSRF